MHISYEDLTPEEHTEICNGCGGKGSWIKPPHAAFFETDCDHHDYGYWIGCTEEDRRKCDLELRRAMCKDVATLPWYKQLRYAPWCALYYVGVRLKGKKYFYYASEKREIVRVPCGTPENKEI